MIVLVVLFLTTILLLYFIWGAESDVSVSDIIPSQKESNAEIELSTDQVCPGRCVYTKGDGTFRIVASCEFYYIRTLNFFKDICEQSTVMASEISKEQYSEALKSHESLVFSYGYSIPFQEFCSFYDIKRTSTFENISAIDEFSLSVAAEDSILVADNKNGRYYRLISDQHQESFEAPIAGQNDLSCYDVSAILGFGSDKLFPISTEFVLSTLKYSAAPEGEDGYGEEIAKYIFGDTFNFVRRIKDSFGNTTYMYGYGQKTLTVSADGRIEYKEEAGSGSSQGFFGDLKTAINFASVIVPVRGSMDLKLNSVLCLKAVSASGTGKAASYTYTFCQKQPSGYETCGSQMPLIEITVKGGKAVSYKGTYLYTRSGGQTAVAAPTADTANILASLSATQEELALLAGRYESLDPVYYMLPDNAAESSAAPGSSGNPGASGSSGASGAPAAISLAKGTLIPAWRLTLSDGTTTYYDLFSGAALQ